MLATPTAKLQLAAGDILLYRPTSVFGALIRFHTGHAISHVELYDGEKQSLASRDGIGVGRYPLRLSALQYVLRPTVPLDFTRIHAAFDAMNGTPYGWWDLADFYGFNVDTKGIVCSPFVATMLRAGGWSVFPEDKVNLVAPYQFLDLVGPQCVLAYGPETLASIIPTAA